MFTRFVIESGQVKAEKSFREILAKLSDGEYTLEIIKKRKKRSLNQNDFYWWPFLDCLCDCMGETIEEMDEKSRQTAKEEVHEFLKHKFWNGKTIRNPLDRRFKIVLSVSTATMDTKEFEAFLEKIRVYFGKWGWVLPYPDSNEPLTEF